MTQLRIKIDPVSVDKSLQIIREKVGKAELIVHKNSLTEIGKAVFTITAKRFLQDLAVAAIEDPARYHHLYEWSALGSVNKKLFKIKQASVKYGNVQIVFIPMKSTENVPISPALLIPGPTGKTVTRRSIFRDKMKVMESGQPVHMITKRTIAFVDDEDNLLFLPKRTVINILHPGGKETTNALNNFAQTWYATKAELIVSQSNLIKQIGNAVAKEINAGNSTPAKIQATIKKVNESYSRGATEF
jgi:hypothetical protein